MFKIINKSAFVIKWKIYQNSTAYHSSKQQLLLKFTTNKDTAKSLTFEILLNCIPASKRQLTYFSDLFLLQNECQLQFWTKHDHGLIERWWNLWLKIEPTNDLMKHIIQSITSYVCLSVLICQTVLCMFFTTFKCIIDTDLYNCN